ncbi:MAG: flagellar hook protein FlgE [Candidatus Sericytochromatia bacterium]|nr:MAG: flagellar hook protein FlgE [Candidatus Sericytochromatia bacterium]
MADVRISARTTLGTINRWIEVISGNLVGSQIIGYKGTRMSFGDSLVDVVRGGTGSTGNVGGINPVQISSGGISVGGTTTDYKQGSLIQTGNNLDLSIQGNAFFTIADSSGKIIYTRAGEFSFDDQGYLVNKEGNFVLGLYDRTREILQKNNLADITAGASGITLQFNVALYGTNPNAGQTGTFSFVNVINAGAQYSIMNYLKDPNVVNRDRAVGNAFVPSGRLEEAGVGTTNLESTTGYQIGTINGVPIRVKLPADLNVATRTSLDNAKLIAAAINEQSIQTGIAASVVINLNDQNQATLVLGHVNRVIAESSVRMPTNPQANDIRDTLTTNETGLIRTYRDNKNNLFFAINSLSLFGKAPKYRPEPGDVFSFDGTGALINNSKGKDADSAPPFNTGIHVAVTKFANAQGLERRRGGSQFYYTEATGGVVVGFAGLSRNSQISSKLGIEENGVSSIGVENVIISQALESSNTSVTDALPELTVAQKTFTSNTKVVNVGNTIVDDLNGLIR